MLPSLTTRSRLGVVLVADALLHRLAQLERPAPRHRGLEALREAALPVSVSEVRMARDPLTATARGALIAGLTEN